MAVGGVATMAQEAELRGRLRILAAVAGVAFLVVGLLAGIARAVLNPGGSVLSLVIFWLGLGGASISAVLLLLLLRRWTRSIVHSLGFAYALLVATAMASGELLAQPDTGTGRWGISGMAIWIVLVPLVYPLPPRWALAGATCCATTVPLVYLTHRLGGGRELSWGVLASWILPLYFCAGLTVLATASLQRYRLALEAARRELRELGRYQLVRRLGQGGMGEVWLASHRLLPRSAAVKFVRAPLASDSEAGIDDLGRRFDAEARAIARLTSPHTVTLYDFGLTDAGERYYVMELLDGIDLHEAVRRHGPLGDARVVRILAQACRSLAEAHAAGLVHRDLKPSNLMICRLGGELDVVKVLDFGLVGGAGSGFPTGDGSTVLGSAGYLAPELLTGSGGVSAAADLYALGCTAWWLLVGAPVHAEARDAHDECVRHCHAPLPEALSRGVHEPALVALVHRLLAKDPARRPSDANALRRELEALACWDDWDATAVAAWWAPIPSLAATEPSRS
jgi:serine/threonine-protein kinase